MTKMRLGTLKRLIREAVSQGYIELNYDADDTVTVHMYGDEVVSYDYTSPNFDETGEDPADAFPAWIEKIASEHGVNMIFDGEISNDLIPLHRWLYHVREGWKEGSNLGEAAKKLKVAEPKVNYDSVNWYTQGFINDDDWFDDPSLSEKADELALSNKEIDWIVRAGWNNGPQPQDLLKAIKDFKKKNGRNVLLSDVHVITGCFFNSDYKKKALKNPNLMIKGQWPA